MGMGPNGNNQLGPGMGSPLGGQNHMGVPGSKSSPMGGDPMQPLPPSGMQPGGGNSGGGGSFKNSPIMSGVPSPADPGYALQFHNFQQQLYATNTRSSHMSQGMGGGGGPPNSQQQNFYGGPGSGPPMQQK